MRSSARLLCILAGIACWATIPAKLWGQNCLESDADFQAVQVLMDIAPDSALRQAKRLQDRFEPGGPSEGLACANQLIATLCFQQSNYPQALDYQLQAHAVWLRINQPAALAASYNQLGWIYYYAGQPDLSLQSFQQAHNRFKVLRDTSGISVTLANLGHLMEKQGKYAEATTYQKQALALSEQIGDSLGMAKIFTHLGSIAEDGERFEEAMSYFLKAQQMYARKGALRELVDVLNNLGDMYQKTGRFEASIGFTRQSMQLAYSLQDKQKLTSAYRDLGETYALMGQPARAYACLDSAWRLYHEVYPDEAARQLAALQALYETERMSTEIEGLRQNERQNLMLTLGAVIGLVLLAALTFLIFRQQRWKIRNERLFAQRNEEIFEKEQQLLRVEIENRRLNELRLQEELTSKSGSLSAHTLHTIRKNQVLDEIKGRLQAILKDRSREYRNEIKATLQLMETHLDQEKEWEDFRSMFEQVHHSFFETLSQRFPDLSPAETRLCALIRLGMESKDMAAFLGISQDSLRISRYRLKRKLGLSQETSLTAFVQALSLPGQGAAERA